MKKSAMMMLLAGLISFGALAQDKRVTRKGGERPTPEKIAEKRTGHMKEQLGLTDAQYKKLYDIHLSEARKHQKSAEERKAQMKAERAELKKQYTAILTPDQLKKMEESRGQRGDFKRKPGERGSREGRGRK